MKANDDEQERKKEMMTENGKSHCDLKYQRSFWSTVPDCSLQPDGDDGAGDWRQQ